MKPHLSSEIQHLHPSTHIAVSRELLGEYYMRMRDEHSERDVASQLRV